MTDYTDIERIMMLNQLCERQGFTYCRSPHGWNDALVSLMATEKHVIYNTDLPFFTGDVMACVNFLRGWEKAHEYLQTLGATSPKIIERKKLDYRNKNLAHLIKHGKKEVKSEAC